MKQSIDFEAYYRIAPPTLILKPNPPYYTILVANDAYKSVTNTSDKDLIGKGVFTAFPQNPNDSETENAQSMYDSFNFVLRTKQQHILPAQRYDIPIRGTDDYERRYWVVTNFPMLDDNGEVSYIIHTPIDITSTFILAKNERIITEVSDSIIKNLKEFFSQAPVAIAMVKGKEMRLELANPHMLQLWGKTADIIGKAMGVALPELIGQPILKLINHTYQSGKSHYTEDAKILLVREGLLQEAYFNMVYHPLRDASDQITGIIILATEVTEQVKGRTALLQEQQRSRLAIEAANLGIFDVDVERGILQGDARCRELFGIGSVNTTDQANDFMNALHPDDRQEVIQLMQNAFKKPIKNDDYDVEFRTLSMLDQQLRWVKAKGKLFFSRQGNPARFIGTVLDITREKREEQLKNDFIAMVSHELKTPLTSLKAYVQLMLKRVIQQKDMFMSESLTKADHQVNKMISMINSFLNIARLEAGGIKLEKNAFELNKLISEVINEVTVIIGPHKILFIENDEFWLEADRDKIGQVLTNLISNAAKYSPENREIKLDCQNLDRSVKVSISDNGIGIRENDLPNLFSRFKRIESEQTRNISGFGIGLYLCAEIVNSHNGKIWAESEYGKGTVFSFELPLLAE
ncbi:ATP-binding protein [Pedobacter hiemivivus]|uniref:histidine kinase n=1 Tax=Pedobacter hiemivivus TaxID=2530454 RepID=A0A4R0MZH7_9SPHI|nr:ATP-binding protein [Pedobacter hiemivivus]TCC92781.1 PAS domain S-box protein [Pedobacter hiemivivus]